MKLDINKILGKIKPWINKFLKYKLFIFFVVIFLIYSFLVFRINMLNNKEPSDSDVSTKLQTVSRPKIDQTIIDKIQQLQDNSVQVKALFKSARDNPFQE